MQMREADHLLSVANEEEELIRRGQKSPFNYILQNILHPSCKMQVNYLNPGSSLSGHGTTALEEYKKDEQKTALMNKRKKNYNYCDDDTSPKLKRGAL